MAQQVLEGTWEEIAAHAEELAGKRIKVIVEPDVSVSLDIPVAGPPNMQALATLHEIAERQKGRRSTSFEDTQRLLREARNGGMYAQEPLDQ